MSTATRSDNVGDTLGDSEHGQLSSRVLSTDEERRLLKQFWRTKKALAKRLSDQLKEKISAEDKKEPVATGQVYLVADESTSLA